jgi:hypothetical protein
VDLCRGLEKPLSERHGRGMARARYGMCESNTAELCKSNGRHNINPFWHDMVGERHGHGRGTAWARHGMCNLAFILTYEYYDAGKKTLNSFYYYF